MIDLYFDNNNWLYFNLNGRIVSMNTQWNNFQEDD